MAHQFFEHHVSAVVPTVVSRVLDAARRNHRHRAVRVYCSSGGCHTNAVGPPLFRTHFASGIPPAGRLNIRGPGWDAVGSKWRWRRWRRRRFCALSISLLRRLRHEADLGLVFLITVPCRSRRHSITLGRCLKIADNALLLEVLAGADDWTRDKSILNPAAIPEALEKPVAGMRIGLMREGFNHRISDRRWRWCSSRHPDFFQRWALRSKMYVPFH